MPQTSFARTFQNVAMDIHGYFKKVSFTILRGTKGRAPCFFFFFQGFQWEMLDYLFSIPGREKEHQKYSEQRARTSETTGHELDH